MRELHVVGTDADGALLLAETPGQPAAFRLADPTPPVRQGRRHVREVREVREVRREPSPAQIQARLRSGVSPEAIARETGADVARVRRWAAPVQAEMGDVLRGALAAVVVDGDRQSSQPLSSLVAAATADTDLQVAWQTTRRRDGRWRVLLRLVDGDTARTASWVWDGRRRRLEAASARARDLSFDD